MTPEQIKAKIYDAIVARDVAQAQINQLSEMLRNTQNKEPVKEDTPES